MTNERNLQQEFTISELSNYIKMAVEGAFPFVKVRGEISGYKKAPSGHVYLNLKDENNVLAAVLWKNSALKVKFKPEDGMEVIASGSVTTYAGQSRYQLVIESLEPAGIGALMALLEQRKKKLAAEGLFDNSRKKPIPYIPSVIGVVTSPTGAVIRDILHRINERFPTHVLVWPSLMQGEKSAEQVSAAINGFNMLQKNKPDVIIVARGGGSIEDLWPFNEEIVVRAVANSSIPVISAIGHETDFTLIDYVADLRAPTPTAAAEMAVPVKAELLLLLKDLEKRCLRSVLRIINDKARVLKATFRPLANLAKFVDAKAQKLDNVTIKLSYIGQNIIKEKQQALTILAKLLESYHYKRVLERGFAIIRNKKQDLIKTSRQAKDSKDIIVEFADGQVEAIIGSVPGNKIKSSKTMENQGNLLF